MTSAGHTDGALVSRALDGLLELSVVGSFSCIGPCVRRRLFEWEPLPRLDDKVVLITGPTSGLGLAATMQMADLGASLRLLGRSRERLDRTVAVVRGAHPEADIEVAAVADMGELAQVRAAAEQLDRSLDRVDVLIHNAGALAPRYETTSEGNEVTVATHVLGPFLLTVLLLPLLHRGGTPRVVTVSSGGMYTERLDVGHLEMRPDDFRGSVAYARAKRAQVALNEQWAQREPSVRFHAMHPGWADTPGVRASLPTFRRVLGPVLRTPESGADTVVWLAGADEPGRSSGLFWLDRRPRSTVHLPRTRPEPGEEQRLWSWAWERVG